MSRESMKPSGRKTLRQVVSPRSETARRDANTGRASKRAEDGPTRTPPSGRKRAGLRVPDPSGTSGGQYRARARRQISMGPPWGALSQTEIGRLARKSTLPLHGQLFLLALAGANRLGHAEFGPSQLRRALSTVDAATGEAFGPSASSVARAIRRAKKEDLLRWDSSASCLVVSDRLFQCGTGSATCISHQVNVRSTKPRSTLNLTPKVKGTSQGKRLRLEGQAASL